MKLDYPPSEHGNFQIAEDTTGHPHPYCITPRHIDVASSKFNGKLSGEAIEFAEKNSNAKCGVKGCNLAFNEHKQAAFVLCKADFQKDKEAEKELQEYMKKHAQDLESKGIVGVGFVDKFTDVLKNEDEGEENE